MGIGNGELVVLIIILVIVFSASRMGALGNAVGRFVHSFKQASKGDGYVDVKPSRKLEKGSTDAEIIDGPKKG